MMVDSGKKSVDTCQAVAAGAPGSQRGLGPGTNSLRDKIVLKIVLKDSTETTLIAAEKHLQVSPGMPMIFHGSAGEA